MPEVPPSHEEVVSPEEAMLPEAGLAAAAPDVEASSEAPDQSEDFFPELTTVARRRDIPRARFMADADNAGMLYFGPHPAKYEGFQLYARDTAEGVVAPHYGYTSVVEPEVQQLLGPRSLLLGPSGDQDQADGGAYVGEVFGYTFLAFPARFGGLGDNRPTVGGTFLLKGDHSYEEMLDQARSAFPKIFSTLDEHGVEVSYKGRFDNAGRDITPKPHPEYAEPYFDEDTNAKLAARGTGETYTPPGPDDPPPAMREAKRRGALVKLLDSYATATTVAQAENAPVEVDAEFVGRVFRANRAQLADFLMKNAFGEENTGLLESRLQRYCLADEPTREWLLRSWRLDYDSIQAIEWGRPLPPIPAAPAATPEPSPESAASDTGWRPPSDGAGTPGEADDWFANWGGTASGPSDDDWLNSGSELGGLTAGAAHGPAAENEAWLESGPGFGDGAELAGEVEGDGWGTTAADAAWLSGGDPFPAEPEPLQAEPAAVAEPPVQAMVVNSSAPGFPLMDENLTQRPAWEPGATLPVTEPAPAHTRPPSRDDRRSDATRPGTGPARRRNGRRRGAWRATVAAVLLAVTASASGVSINDSVDNRAAGPSITDVAPGQVAPGGGGMAVDKPDIAKPRPPSTPRTKTVYLEPGSTVWEYAQQESPDASGPEIWDRSVEIMDASGIPTNGPKHDRLAAAKKITPTTPLTVPSRTKR